MHGRLLQGELQETIDDCTESLKVKPGYAKALQRRSKVNPNMIRLIWQLELVGDRRLTDLERSEMH